MDRFIALRSLLAFILCLAMVAVSASLVLASIGDPTSISIGDVWVFRDVLEPGDQLFFVRYVVHYDPVPTEEPGDTWQMALHDAGGALVATRPLNYFQHNIISIYLTPAKAIAWEGPHVVRIMGNPAVFPSLVEGVNTRAVTLGSGNFREGRDLGGIMLTQAGKLETAWAITLLTAGGRLNATGATFFNEAMPGLPWMVPEIYAAAVARPGAERLEWAAGYGDILQMHEGSRLRGAITGIGTIFGISEGWAGFWLGGIGLLVLSGIVYAATRDSGLAIITGFPVVLGYAWIGLGTSWLYIGLITVVLVAVFFGVAYILAKFA